jgi:hypothetical protein
VLAAVYADINRQTFPIPQGTKLPRAVKRARNNSYRIKKAGEHSIRHPTSPTINIRALQPRGA